MGQVVAEIPTSQSDVEIDGLIDILRWEGVNSFLEIGSRFGGSLDRIARALPVGSRIVSCDSGKGMGGRKPGAQNSLKDVVSRLYRDGYDAHLIIGHSQSATIVKAVNRLGPFGAAFIDGDHEYAGAKTDWENFRSPITAFHDIAWKQPATYMSCAKQVEVPRLWAELREQYRHAEIIDPTMNMGIGVLWT